jgi:hypothetical protein
LAEGRCIPLTGMLYEPVTQFETRQMQLETWDQATLADWVDVLATFPLFSGIAKRRRTPLPVAL